MPLLQDDARLLNRTHETRIQCPLAVVGRRVDDLAGKALGTELVTHVVAFDGDNVVFHLSTLGQIKAPLRAHVSCIPGNVPNRHIIGNIGNGLTDVIGIVCTYLDFGYRPLRIFDAQIRTQVHLDRNDRVVIPRNVNARNNRKDLNTLVGVRRCKRQINTCRIDRDDVDTP